MWRWFKSHEKFVFRTPQTFSDPKNKFEFFLKNKKEVFFRIFQKKIHNFFGSGPRGLGTGKILKRFFHAFKSVSTYSLAVNLSILFF